MYLEIKMQQVKQRVLQILKAMKETIEAIKEQVRYGCFIQMLTDKI